MPFEKILPINDEQVIFATNIGATQFATDIALEPLDVSYTDVLEAKTGAESFIILDWKLPQYNVLVDLPFGEHVENSTINGDGRIVFVSNGKLFELNLGGE